MTIEDTIRETLGLVTGKPQPERLDGRALLEHDLGVDSLALLEVVETLQSRLAILIPDEVTARIRTVADLQNAVTRLVAPLSEPPLRSRSA